MFRCGTISGETAEGTGAVGVRVYLGLGGNMGDRAAALAEARTRLGAAGLEAVATSRLYETEPQGRRDQAWFLNQVVAVDTERDAFAVLQTLMDIEQAMGRRRLVHWGPRVIDLDLLLYGIRRIHDGRLDVPHPRLHERAFALVPLAEIAPDAEIPGQGYAAELAHLRRMEPGQAVRPWPAVSTSAHASSAPTRARLLQRLRTGGGQAQSGVALAREMGVSRAAIWKHVRRLRSEGYDIPGTSGSGYVLRAEAGTLDPLTSADLTDARRTRVGRVLHVLRQVDSTNVLARQLGLAGSADGTAVVAEEQTAGRGRNGRGFLSPQGGVYLSVVLRPRLPPAQASRLTLLGALAVCEAIEGWGGLQPTIKWPNDILLPGGKVCGILLELVAREDCVDFIVLGAGVNVQSCPAGVEAASLHAAGVDVGRAAVANAILNRLDANYVALNAGRWSDLLSAWRRRCSTLGQAVEVAGIGGDKLQGIAVDVTLEGALLVDVGDAVRTVFAGDVRHLRPSAGRAATEPPPRDGCDGSVASSQTGGRGALGHAP